MTVPPPALPPPDPAPFAPPAQAAPPPADPVLRPPVLLSPVLPAYPGDGYRIVLEGGGLVPQAGVGAIQGRVVLRLLVRADGTVARVELAESSGHASLDRAAQEVARLWRFAPATRDGEPIAAWVIIAVRFVVP